MDKFAMLKEAEVAGVLSAFMDNGYMAKLASDDFEYVVEKVAENLGDSYTVEDVADVTGAVLNGAVMDKTAEEVFVDNVAPVIGAAYMAKIAGEITDDEMEEFAMGYVEDALC